MRAELRLLRQPFFFLLFYFFPITLHIFRTRHLKAHSSNGKQNVTSKVKWRCFKLHRHISVQFSEFHLGEFSRVQKKAKNQRCLLLTLPLKAKLGNFRSYQNAPQNALQNVCCHATFTLGQLSSLLHDLPSWLGQRERGLQAQNKYWPASAARNRRFFWNLITSVRLIQVGNNRNDHFRYFLGVRVLLIEVSA